MHFATRIWRAVAARVGCSAPEIERKRKVRLRDSGRPPPSGEEEFDKWQFVTFFAWESTYMHEPNSELNYPSSSILGESPPRRWARERLWIYLL